jgi:hypothetical protein
VLRWVSVALRRADAPHRGVWNALCVFPVVLRARS